MSTTIRPVRLVRPTLSSDPRVAARVARIRLAPKAAPEGPLEDPLADWRPGFSTRTATDHLEDIGCTMPGRPNDPHMPQDVTVMASQHLGMIYAQYVAYTEWLESHVALAEIDADEQVSYLEHVEAEIRLRKAGTVKDKDSKTKNDLRYIAQEQVMLCAQAKAKLLKARYKGYERCANALSREMTRRVPVARTD
jgi:hypothetical protein